MKKFILALFLVITIVFSASEMSYAENIKFVQVADALLSVNSEYSQKVLKSAIDDINTQEGVSFVVFTGNNINSPKEENLRAFLQIVKGLKVPYYLSLGNNDVYKSNGLSKVRYFEVLRYYNWFTLQTGPNFKFRKKGFVFLIADGAKEIIPGSVGYYKEKTLSWLDEVLTKNKNKDVVIFQHFPIEYPDGISEKSSHKTYKVENYRSILEKHKNVLAIISGHHNVNSENMKNGIYHISTPSLLTIPQSYKIIDIVTTKEFSPIIYTQLREFEIKE